MKFFKNLLNDDGTTANNFLRLLAKITLIIGVILAVGMIVAALAFGFYEEGASVWALVYLLPSIVGAVFVMFLSICQATILMWMSTVGKNISKLDKGR